MGWFDSLFPSSTRIDVNTTVSRVIDDSGLPDSIKAGTIKSLFADGDLSDYLMEEVVNSVAVRAERMYTYAERKYAYGMPSGEIYAAVQERAAVEDVLKRLHDSTVVVEYSRFGPPNSLHIAWTKIAKDYGYSAVTNTLGTLTAQKKTPVYLKDMVVVVPAADFPNYSATAFEQYGIAPTAGYTPERPAQTGSLGNLATHTPIQLSDTATEVHVVFSYCWQEDGMYKPAGYSYQIPGKVTKTESVVLNVSGFNYQKDYFQVRYKHAGNTYFLMYESGSGVYPTLDSAFDTPVQVMGEFFPFAYFRYGKAPMNGDRKSDGYITSRKMLKYLNMDFDSLVESVHQNPGIADVEQAMMVMAIPANASDKLGARYLFDFFNKLYYFLPAQFTSINEVGLSTPLATPSVNASAITITDRLFRMVLSNGSITKKRRTGSIGPEGTYTTAVETQYSTINVSASEFNNAGTYQVKTTAHVYRFQVSDATYDEIRVADLNLKYSIWGSYTTIGDENDAILLVPLDRSITKNYTMQDREDLYTRSLHFVFNSLVRTEIKWYQSQLFQSLLMIAAIVITVWSLGSTWQSIGAAMAAGATTEAIVLMIALEILKVVAVGAALKMFVKSVGVEAAFVLAIVAAVYGGYQAISSGSISGAPWAEELLSISSGLTSSIQDNLGEMLGELSAEAQQFSLYISEQEKALEKANDLLKQDNLLSPFVIFGESPNDYYNRTVHSGNIGVLGIEAISSYADVALTLPKLSDTLGGDLNGYV